MKGALARLLTRLELYPHGYEPSAQISRRSTRRSSNASSTLRATASRMASSMSRQATDSCQARRNSG